MKILLYPLLPYRSLNRVQKCFLDLYSSILTAKGLATIISKTYRVNRKNITNFWVYRGAFIIIVIMIVLFMKEVV